MQGQKKDWTYHTLEGVVMPVHPATPQQIALNVKRWREEKIRKERKAVLKKAATITVTQGKATIGDVLVAKLVKAATK